MSAFGVEILPAAEHEFNEAFLWYFDRSRVASQAFRADVLDAIDALVTDADAWPKNDDGFHFRVLSRFPYTIHYELAAGIATIFAIAHQRWKPGYWGERGSATFDCPIWDASIQSGLEPEQPVGLDRVQDGPYAYEVDILAAAPTRLRLRSAAAVANG